MPYWWRIPSAVSSTPGRRRPLREPSARFWQPGEGFRSAGAGSCGPQWPWRPDAPWAAGHGALGVESRDGKVGGGATEGARWDTCSNVAIGVHRTTALGRCERARSCRPHWRGAPQCGPLHSRGTMPRHPRSATDVTRKCCDATQDVEKIATPRAKVRLRPSGFAPFSLVTRMADRWALGRPRSRGCPNV
jgi:hypothetical protein